MLDLAVQAETFVLLTAAGILLGIIFDFYRVLRGVYKPRGLVTAAGDLAYWFIATVIVGGTLLYSNWGEMRLYVVLALLAGAGGYFKLLSRTFIRLMIYGVRWMTTAMRWLSVVIRWVKIGLYYALVKPVTYPARVLALPFIYCGRKLRNWCRRFDSPDEKPPV